jgi:hypothetical protein
MRFAMMHDMMWGMMGGMGLISVLGVIVLALGAAALIKYLILSNRQEACPASTATPMHSRLPQSSGMIAR